MKSPFAWALTSSSTSVDGVCVPVAVPVVDDDGVTDGDDVPVIPVNGECCVVVVG